MTGFFKFLKRVTSDTGPLNSAWNVLSASHKIFFDSRLTMVAGSLAYTSILSLIPFLAVSLSIFQAFKGLDGVYAMIEPIIVENLAQGAGEQAMTAIRGFVQNIHGGTLGITGLIGLIITSMSMLLSVENAINQIWKVENTRSFFEKISSYWFFITLGPISLALVAGFTSASETGTKLLPSGVWGILTLTAILTAVYKWVPCRSVRLKSAFVPALITAVLFQFARVLYGIYVSKIVSYNKIYGSLGAIPILILWIYLIWVIILAGAALSFAIQFKWDNKK